MTAESTTPKRLACPSCDSKAKRVSTLTMHALLKDSFASQFGHGGQSCCDSQGDGCHPIEGDTGWRFCDSKACDVVYFSEDSDTEFTKSHLKVAVGVKEIAGDRPLCYCFEHSVASIKEDIQATGKSIALEDIRAKMKSPGCDCETKNPSGACCLGAVKKGVEIAQEELNCNGLEPQPSSVAKRVSNHRGETIAKIGTLVSAIMASSCCWLPLLLLTVGVSGAGIASTLEAYRPLFMIVTFGFLGAAFYFTYRPKKAATNGDSCCVTEPQTGDCCAPANKGLINVKTLNKAMLWVVTVMAVVFLLFPNYVGAFLGGGDKEAVTDSMNSAVIKVEGMTCEGCSALVAKAIRTVPGVLAVEVNYEKGEANVGTEICCPIPTEAILNALKDAGYAGRFITADRPRTPESASTKQVVSPLHDLTADARELRDEFNASIGKARVIMLVSPG